MATRPDPEDSLFLGPDLRYELPPDRIAQKPVARRDGARMMLVARHASEAPLASNVASLADYLDAGDLLVRNRTRVFPARLRGRRLPGGGSVEVLLLQADPSVGADCWQALARPLKRLRVGQRLVFGGDSANSALEVTVAKVAEGYLWLGFPEGTDVLGGAERFGEIPLPPYIQRPEGPTGDDRQRYQTIYASETGSVAAPTAGLHLTDEIFAALERRGVGVADVVLHVGAATFLAGQPGRDPGKVEPETYYVPPETRERIARCRGRVVAVGTTTTRALESAARQGWPEAPRSTGLVLQPGDEFSVVQGMLTNLHLPGSSLLSLVAAFAGIETTRRAYQTAIAEDYRFYSYGDAMLII